MDADQTYSVLPFLRLSQDLLDRDALIKWTHRRRLLLMIHCLAKFHSRNRDADNLIEIKVGDTMRLMRLSSALLYSAMNAEIEVCCCLL